MHSVVPVTMHLIVESIQVSLDFILFFIFFFNLLDIITSFQLI